jgi:hypothetical protein
MIASEQVLGLAETDPAPNTDWLSANHKSGSRLQNDGPLPCLDPASISCRKSPGETRKPS